MEKRGRYKSVWDKVPKGLETRPKRTAPPTPTHFDANPPIIEARSKKAESIATSRSAFEQEQIIKLFGSQEAFEATVTARKNEVLTNRSDTITTPSIEAPHISVYAPDLTEMPNEIPLNPGVPANIGEQPTAFQAD